MAKYVIVVEALSCPSCPRSRTTETVTEVGKPRVTDNDSWRCQDVFDGGCCNLLYRRVSVLNG